FVIDITVGINEDGSAGQVGEQGACVTLGNVQAKDAGVVDELPVGHEEDSEREDGGLHNLKLGTDERLLLRGSSEDRIAVRGKCRRRFAADQVGCPVCLSPRELSKSQEEENRSNCEVHWPPPGNCWRRRWGWSSGRTMDDCLIEP